MDSNSLIPTPIMEREYRWTALVSFPDSNHGEGVWVEVGVDVVALGCCGCVLHTVGYAHYAATCTAVLLRVALSIVSRMDAQVLPDTPKICCVLRVFSTFFHLIGFTVEHASTTIHISTRILFLKCESGNQTSCVYFSGRSREHSATYLRTIFGSSM